MRFYFDLCDDEGIWPDEEGQQLVDFQAAKIEAARSLVGMAEASTAGEQAHRMAVQVRTANGLLFEAAFNFQRRLS
jgi:hypothetical protein